MIEIILTIIPVYDSDGQVTYTKLVHQ